MGPSDAPIHWFERIGSTQDAAHQLAADGAPAGTAVVAVEQTAARGSRGRAWVSPRGGLWLSVICRPEVSPAPAAISLRAALVVAEVLDAYGAGGVRVKWPNDLMLDDRKVGGILCEARWTGDTLGWVVIGAGVNVQNAIPAEVAPLAARLGDHLPDLRAGDLAEPMARALERIGPRAGLLDDGELRAFAARDWLAGRAIRGPVAGIAGGISRDGALRVCLPGGAVRLVRVGPVVPVGASTLHV